MNIIDFLPNYSNINDHFQSDIFRRKEFHDLKLSKDDKPELPSSSINSDPTKLFFKHQLIIQRFLSNHTPYDSLLLFHSMGTGKTKASILVAEINKNVGKPKALILTKNETIEFNYKKQLSEANSKYLEKGTDPSDKTNLLTRATKKDYDFETFEAFSVYLSKLDDNSIINTYSNRIIIIDEAHNLRINAPQPTDKSKPDPIHIYKQFHRFLHLVQNCKILLMTGTPIWDTVEEIASLMNLILPLDKQLEYKDFEKTYFSKGKLIKQKLLDTFQGRVSYLRALESGAYKKLIGKVYPPLEYTKLQLDEMSDFQNEAVENAKEGVFNRFKLEASNFAYEFEGETYYGKEFQDKFMINRKNDWEFNKNYKIIKKDIKDNLKKYSNKYYNIIQNILKCDGSVFVYSHKVENGGGLLFGLILELFGFDKYDGVRNISDEKARYAIISSKYTSEPEMKKINKIWNSKENKDGKLIKVLIGSAKMSEGISLKNVKEGHIVSPFYHMSNLDQAIGRIIRYDSHPYLEKGQTFPVKIFMHASSYKDELTVDIQVYDDAEKKDIKNRQVYRFLKEISFDCPLTYERNIKETDVDGSKECDYQKCDYDCYDENLKKVDNEYFIPKDKIINTNYNLYYSSQDINSIILYFENFFKFNEILNLNEFNNQQEKVDFKYLNNFSKELILKALEKIVYSKKILFNRYGFPSLLKETNNIFYLDTNINALEVDKSFIYKKKDIVIKSNISLEDIIIILSYKDDEKVIEKICKISDEDIEQRFKKLNNRIKSVLFETLIFKETKNPKILKLKKLLNPELYKINNEEIFKDLLKELEKALKVGKHIKEAYTRLYGMIEDLKFENKKQIIEKLDNYKNYDYKELINDLKNLLLDKDKGFNKIAYAHFLFNAEESTLYKKNKKANGLTRIIFEDFDGKDILGKDTLGKENIGKDNLGWHFSPFALEEIYTEYVNSKALIKQKEEKNEYNLHGTFKNNIFKIHDQTTSNPGFNCSQTSNKIRIIEHLVNIFNVEKNIEKDEDKYLDINFKEYDNPLKYIKSNFGEIVYKDRFVKTIEDEEELLNVFIYFYGLTKAELCKIIKDWFKKNNLLFE